MTIMETSTVRRRQPPGMIQEDLARSSARVAEHRTRPKLGSASSVGAASYQQPAMRAECRWLLEHGFALAAASLPNLSSRRER